MTELGLPRAEAPEQTFPLLRQCPTVQTTMTLATAEWAQQ